MGGFNRSKASMVAILWFVVATTTTLLVPTTTTVHAERTTSRNLKTYIKQRNQKQQSEVHGSRQFPHQQISSTNSLPTNVQSSLPQLARKPKRALMGMMGKSGKGGNEYDDDDSYGKGKGKSKKDKKGKGKSKKGKGKGHGLPEICSKLDFGEEQAEDDYLSKGKGKGKGYRQQRDLQFDGALCEPNVFDEAKNIVDLSIFVSLIEQAKLEEIFLCAGPFTILAPNNAAFVDNPSLTKYLADNHNIKELREVLLYHILPGLTLVDEFTKGSIEALQGDVIEVTVDPLLFNNVASVKESDIIVCNGAINIIDSILIPPGTNVVPDICKDLDFSSLSNRRLQYDGEGCDPNVLETAKLNKDLSTFVELIEVAGLTEYFMCSGPFTLLAPTNEAFEALESETLDELLLPSNQDKLRDLLLYHIVPGLILSADFEDGSLETLFDDQNISVMVDPIIFNGRAAVVEADIIACNGVIHAIDDVLVPVTDVCQMFTFDGETDGANCMLNILEVARQIPDFALSVTLIERAELTDIFSCPGPFTANLPSNAAWDEVDPAFLELILRPENVDQLEDLLLYHVLPGLFSSTSLVAGPSETLLAGETVSISLNPTAFNGVEVDQADIEACNGLLNLLRSLLIPSGTPTPQPTPVKAPVPSPAQIPTPLVSPTDDAEPTIAPSFGIGPATPIRQPAIPTSGPSICEMYDFGGETDGADCSPNILDTAREMSELSLAVILFERAGLTGIFDCAGPFTVQLPTNDAVENVDAALLDFLLRPENQAELMNLMLYHVLPGSFPTSDLRSGPTPTLAGDAPVVISLNPTMFNNATVLMADISACNGLINTIDSVLTFLPTTPTTTPSEAPDETDSPTPPEGSPTVAPAKKSEQPATSREPSLVSIPPSSVPFAVPVGSPVIGGTATPTITASPTEGTPTPVPDSDQPMSSSGSDTPSASPVIGGTTAPTVSPVIGGTPAPTVTPVIGGTPAPGLVSDPPSASPISTPVDGGTAAPTVTPVIGGTPAPTVTPVIGGTPAPGLVSDPPSASPISAPNDGGTAAPTITPVIGGTPAPGLVSDPPSASPISAPVDGGTAAPTVTPVIGGTPAPTVTPVIGGTPAPGLVSDPPSSSPISAPIDGGTAAPTVTPIVGGTSAPTVTPVVGGTAAPTAAPVVGGTPAPGLSVTPNMQETDPPAAVGAPTEEPVLRIRVENFFLAYSVPGAVEPTEDQYSQLVDATNDFFTDTFTAMFNNTGVGFLRAESTLGFALFNASIPAERFNVYTDYNFTDLIYTTNSTPPDAAASFVLLRNSLTMEYITDYVRALTDTPFVTANEVVFRASTMEGPSNNTQQLQRSGNTKEDTNGLAIATISATSAAALLILAAAALVYRKKRAARRRDEALYDGIYAAEGKATLEGYFTEQSVTDTSETAAGKSSARLPVVYEESQPRQIRV